MRKTVAAVTKNANVFMIIILMVHTFLPVAPIQPAVIRDQGHGIKVSIHGYCLYENKYVFDNMIN